MADVSEESTEGERQSRRNARKCAHVSKILMREEFKAQMKKVSEILKKCEPDRTEEEMLLLEQSPDIVKNIEKRNKLRQLTKHRQLEIEDNEEELGAKCLQLAQAIRAAKYVVLYTGAGISTAASIPDYRGPSGVWTLLQQGIQPKVQDLSVAEPTYTHMAIKKLHQMGVVKYVVSQNCDGLHLRSGLPRHVLSELHGNMFIEVCRSCSPPKEYLRLFDVTERTGVRKHQTGRHCRTCGEELRDSIVHFGERSPGLESPYNWEEAAQAADQADLILCIGSSLKVLKKYPCLWSAHKPASQRPDLYIVNLQWTPKDDGAVLKLNGRCDAVLRRLLQHLGLTADAYNVNLDPIYCLATPLPADELTTTNKNILVVPPNYNKAAVLSNIQHEQLRSMERKKRRGKKRKGSGKGGIADQAYSNFYEEKLLCGVEDTVEDCEDVRDEVFPGSVQDTPPKLQISPTFSDGWDNKEVKNTAKAAEDEKYASSKLGDFKGSERNYQATSGPVNEMVVRYDGQGTKSETGSVNAIPILHMAAGVKTKTDSNRKQGHIVTAAEVTNQPSSLPPNQPTVTSTRRESAEKPATLGRQVPYTQSGLGPFIQAPLPAAMQNLPLGPFMHGQPMLPGTLLPFPMALPATSPDLTQERNLESIKFHQTLQMLQLQSQLHMHQQALTEQLPPAEQAKLRMQQDMMRQAFNSLITQQLIKLEQPTATTAATLAVASQASTEAAAAVMAGVWQSQQAMAAPKLSPSTSFYPVPCPQPAMIPSVVHGQSPNTLTSKVNKTQDTPPGPCALPVGDMPGTQQIKCSQASPQKRVKKRHQEAKGQPSLASNSADTVSAHTKDSSFTHLASVPSHSSQHSLAPPENTEEASHALQAVAGPSHSGGSTLSISYPTIVSALHGKYSPNRPSVPGAADTITTHKQSVVGGNSEPPMYSKVGDEHMSRGSSYKEYQSISGPALQNIVVSEHGVPNHTDVSYQSSAYDLPASGEMTSPDREAKANKAKRRRKNKERTKTHTQSPPFPVHITTLPSSQAPAPQLLSPKCAPHKEEEPSPTDVPSYSHFSEPAAFSQVQPGEISENERVKVEGLTTMAVNPMIAIQSRLLAEEEEKLYAVETETSGHQPLVYSSLFSEENPASHAAAEPSLQDVHALGFGPQEISVGSPGKALSESEVVYNNVALVETVVTEPDIVTEDFASTETSTEAETEEGLVNNESPTTSINSSPVGLTAPGWFGKGWNPKKFKKRKRSK